VEQPLAASDEHACHGFFVWNQEPVRDVFLILNGSGTLSNAFVPQVFEPVLQAGQVALVICNKPGIHAPFGDPAAVQRDDALMRQYTLATGLACAVDAVRQTRARFGPSVRIHLRGHSEGAWLALLLYDGLLGREPEVASSIASLVLSGLPQESFAEILDRQLAGLPDGSRIHEALASCDWPLLRDRLGLSCAYVEDAKRRFSGRALFERLASRAAPARFEVFQGTEDWHTPVAPIRALQTWNAQEGHLRIAFHYYSGGHNGTDAARMEIARLLTDLIAR
jgi:pimeloyl-ACP methyl ester carboxylesterase